MIRFRIPTVLSALLAACATTSAEPALKEGDPAPAFKAVGDDGQDYSLAALHGKYVVLYFYPKDDSSGCTTEAKGFRDDSDKYALKGAIVLGVSMDDAESHKAFREKYSLNFPLLVEGQELAKAYQVPVTLGFSRRQTFVIGRDGKLLRIFRDVTPAGHSAEILALLR